MFVFGSGAIGFIWSICWFVFIFETPAVHPRISEEERKDIEDAIGSTTSKKRPTYVPWGSILSSPAVWAIILTHGNDLNSIHGCNFVLIFINCLIRCKCLWLLHNCQSIAKLHEAHFGI